MDYEIEFAAVIGRVAKNVSPENALDYVAGYCVFNDISARDIQAREHANKVILLGKSFDTSCPLGPWLTTSDEIADPQALTMQLRLNGELRQNSNTRDMVFSMRDLVSWWSQITLEPGDVITSGSPSWGDCRPRKPGLAQARRSHRGDNRGAGHAGELGGESGAVDVLVYQGRTSF